jgi:hypothetical protein
MRVYGLPYGLIIVIRDAEKLALLTDYFAYGEIVDVTDLREEVMLYLEIEAAYQPGNYSVSGSKIGCGPYFMNSPFGVDDLGGLFGYDECGLFYHMRQLKYDS